jgi:hypothetical protein
MFYSGIMADIGALEEMRKRSIMYVMSVRLQQRLYNWRYFHEICYIILSRKCV